MSIEGRIAVDVSFADSATSDGVQSLKKITLTDTTSYTTGKVAIVTGTVGTAAQSLTLSNYRDASGDTVSFSEGKRAVFQCVGATGLFLLQAVPVVIGAHSSGGASVCDIPFTFPSPSNYRVQTLNGTATYTLVLYGT